MAANPGTLDHCASQQTLSQSYSKIRSTSPELCKHLEPEDFVVQSMPDVSPTKWHLAHTTWFFEQFILKTHVQGYQCFDDGFHHLFNSYYHTAGAMHPRPSRGLLSRPLVKEVLNYREHVDQAMLQLLDQNPDDSRIGQLVTLGLNHEQQHQELLLTDIKHVFSCNPMLPAVRPDLQRPATRQVDEYAYTARSGGLVEIGASGWGFCFDNETPRHQVLLQDHQMGSRLVTNGEYLEFIRDGGYRTSDLWLSDGWTTVNQLIWNRPLYWDEDLASEFTLGGQRELDLNAPVVHVSYYEADAFARWSNARLPTEAEWETSACDHDARGNLLQSDLWHPASASDQNQQFFGDVWEWTASSYAPYPGFKPLEGSLGEYNGKFMCNQMSVRGGSCVTSDDHIRGSYRSFFYPEARWQFLGIRLARDGNSD